ncbi:hypothetical protein AtNW77_Chr1g0030831 [Arabidopsis thaliana]|uniref:Uncharacterized protein n=2 Tax=Arabidopsis TaxID=3701 RepID=A0A178WI90_ARATH|nr:hypothetical protein ISN45_At01g027930 [Arabidopsis thaliana x Arabidopsis arenosa]OAP18099.1 hypothetical protein AXX17_AT1G28440 [Arabidopsis thaliana]VYS47375.1 unnamed protein product [Arabidopsis thaliana]
MADITEYLERSMQNCSLIDRRSSMGDGFGMSDEHIPISDRFLELSTHFSVPSHLEQCLDLKTGEIYYRSWNSGMRVKEDPRKSMSRGNYADQSSGESSGTVFSSEEVSSYYESEESSSESSPSSRKYHKEEEEADVLVVAGCKACLMYFMVPKLFKDCPKCATQLLHFDQLHSTSP